MEQLYSYLGISRQSAHQAKVRRKLRLEVENDVVAAALEIRKRHPKMGSRVLYKKLNNPRIGITAFERLMSIKGLTVARKRKRIITTINNRERRFPNVINGLKINDINQLIVGDITYFRSSDIIYYIFTLKDFYSGRIVGLTGDTNMRSDKALDCLSQLLKLRGSKALKGLTHHTDGGTQYRSDNYLNWLRRLEIKISQAENCMQNGCAEQFNDIVKNHYLLNEDIESVKQLQKALSKIKKLINYERPVKKLGYLTPVNFEQQIQDIELSDRKVFECFNFDLRVEQEV